MSEVYDFSTGFNFSSWAKQFDEFHDWVVLELRIFIDDDSELTAQQYRAELVLVDPYERFDIKKSTSVLRTSKCHHSKAFLVLAANFLGLFLIKLLWAFGLHHPLTTICGSMPRT